MRLVDFTTPTTGTLTLPTFEASSQPVNKQIRLKIARTANGPVIDLNGGSADQIERLTHRATYLFPAVQAQQALIDQWTQAMGQEGTLKRATSDVAQTLSESIGAILVGFVVNKTSQDVNGSKYSMECTMTFMVNDPTSAGWS